MFFKGGDNMIYGEKELKEDIATINILTKALEKEKNNFNLNMQSQASKIRELSTSKSATEIIQDLENNKKRVTELQAQIKSIKNRIVASTPIVRIRMEEDPLLKEIATNNQEVLIGMNSYSLYGSLLHQVEFFVPGDLPVQESWSFNQWDAYKAAQKKRNHPVSTSKKMFYKTK